MRRLRRILRDERGDVEDLPGYAILAVGAIIIIGVILYVGKASTVANTVQAAAYAAARDASLSRTAAVAVPHAQAAAEQSLAGNVNCVRVDVTIGGNGLSTGLGQTGIVTATVTCTINTGDLALNLVPGTTTITKTASSPVDPYRQR